MQKIKFTLLMCTYKNDNPLILEKAIKSIYENSIIPNQFILTIDGPIPEENEKVIKRLSKIFPLKLNYLSINIGLAKALNKSLEMVKTEWIARADSDDISLSERFSIQIIQARNDHDIIGSLVKEIDYEKNIPDLIKKIPLKDKEIKKYLKFRNPINHMTVFGKTELIRKVGGYPNIYLKEDYGLWIKLASIGAKFHNINKVLVIASGGNSLYKRRSGIRSALSEIKLQYMFLKYKLKPLHKIIIDLIIRSTFLLLPNNLNKNIYIKKFRVKNK